MGGRGSLRGDGAWPGGEAGGLEQGGWGLERISKSLGGWGLEGAKGLGLEGGKGWTLRDGTDKRLFGQMDGNSPSVLYDIVPFGSAAQKAALAMPKKVVRC